MDTTKNPAPADVLAARQRAGLTQAQAGALLYVNALAWFRWESGARKMHPAFWELFGRKCARSRPRPG
jgi:DNA-binding transcriptional regulator YiaG